MFGENEALMAELLACERTVWEALRAGDHAAESAALAEDFLGIYPDGFAGKAAHMGQVADGPSVAEYTLSEARVIQLGFAHAVLAYRADFRRSGEEVMRAIYVSSIWERSEGAWVNVFSQDTPVAEVP